jgi:short-subunit dehydrogenase
MNTTAKTILITGAGSGIALQTAIELAKIGHHVIATARSIPELDDLQQQAESQQLVLTYDALDITNNDQAVALAKKYTIDTLINSAANGETGPIVEEPMQRVRANFETNVFGTLQVIQAFAPQMIARKSGRIIVVSSFVGLALPMFFNSYASTKAAMESIAGSLRNELRYFNVDVVIMNPGRIDGGHNAKIAATKYDWIKKDSPYHALEDEMKTHDRLLLDNAYPIRPVVLDMIKAVQATRPRIRYASPSKYRLGLVLIRLMPTRFQDWVFFKADRLKFLK